MKPSERINQIYEENKKKDTPGIIYSYLKAVLDYLDEQQAHFCDCHKCSNLSTKNSKEE